MAFLNSALLGGVAAAAVPLLIYLFNRSRYRRQPWAAMHLLQTRLSVNRRRLQFEHLLLLVVRAAIPALLALCMARPIVTGVQHLVRQTRSSVVVLLDNSFSMEGGDEVRTNFARATEETARVLEDLPPGSQVAVLGMGGPVGARDGVADDVSAAGKVLRAATSGYGVANVTDALTRAAALFAGSMHHADRQLLVVTDFQRVSWPPEARPARERALALLRAGPVPPTVVLLDVGPPPRENVAAAALELTPAVVGVRQPVRLRANLVNYGPADYPDQRVFLLIDGEHRAAAQVTLAGGQTTQVLFAHTFETAGSHLVEVRIDADRLTADNSCRRSVPVLAALPVLLVDGRPSAAPLQSETAYLEIAMAPFATAGERPTDLIAVRTIAAAAFAPEPLKAARIVVLANVPALTDSQLATLQSFVASGGGLLIFPGDRVDQSWYNQKLAGDGSGLLPLHLLSLAGRQRRGQPAAIVSQHYTHPALELFNDPKNGGLDGAELRVWYRLGQPAAAGAGGGAGQATVLAKLDSGDPFLVERDYGQGRVILCATASDTDWGNLPLRPFFLPLVQQLAAYLAAKVYPPRNLEAGQQLAALLPAGDAGGQALLTDPAGGRHPLPVVPRDLYSAVEYDETRLPGLYLLTPPAGDPIHYVVNPPRAESDLERLRDDEIAAVAQSLDAAVVRSARAYRDREQSRRFGQEIWVPLLWLALAAVFAELFLEHYFTHRRL